MTNKKTYQLLKALRNAEWEAHDFHAYAYETDISDRILLAAVYGGLEIPIMVSRQAGKTTAVVRTIAFLLKYAKEIFGDFFAVGFFTPQRQQVKTDRDRLVRLLKNEQGTYGFHLPEVNQDTVRLAYGEEESSECYMFAVGPTSHPESKTLNMAIIEESHKINDAIVNNDIRPMLAATNGSFIWTGVAGTKRKHFKVLSETSKLGMKITADIVINEKRIVYAKTHDPMHLQYERFIDKERERLGADSIPFLLNYSLEWCIGKGKGIALADIEAVRHRDEINFEDTFDWLSVGIDHARNHDRTWVIIIGQKEGWETPRIVWIEQLPAGMKYPKQAEEALERVGRFKNAEQVVIVPDSTGQGDFMGDLIEEKSGGVYSDSDGSLVRYKFTSQGKDETGMLLQQMFRHKTVLIPHARVTNDEESLNTLEVELIDLEIEMNGALMTWHAPESSGDSIQEEAHDDAVATLMLALVGMKKIKEMVTANITILG